MDSDDLITKPTRPSTVRKPLNTKMIGLQKSSKASRRVKFSRKYQFPDLEHDEDFHEEKQHLLTVVVISLFSSTSLLLLRRYKLMLEASIHALPFVKHILFIKSTIPFHLQS